MKKFRHLLAEKQAMEKQKQPALVVVFVGNADDVAATSQQEQARVLFQQGMECMRRSADDMKQQNAKRL